MGTKADAWRACALIVVGLTLPAYVRGAPLPAPQGLPGGYSHSTLQGTFIDVEGATNGLPDHCGDGRCGRFTVNIRDDANNAIAGANVVIDFAGCPDIQISCDQLTATTGQTYFTSKKVSGITNAAGQFAFQVQGAAYASRPASGISPGTNAGVPCATVYVEGVPLGALKVCAYDIDGLGSPSAAVSATDVALVAYENGQTGLGAQGRARDDYDHSGTITVVDVSLESQMNGQSALGTGSQSTGSYCP